MTTHSILFSSNQKNLHENIDRQLVIFPKCNKLSKTSLDWDKVLFRMWFSSLLDFHCNVKISLTFNRLISSFFFSFGFSVSSSLLLICSQALQLPLVLHPPCPQQPPLYHQVQ